MTTHTPGPNEPAPSSRPGHGGLVERLNAKAGNVSWNSDIGSKLLREAAAALSSLTSREAELVEAALEAVHKRAVHDALKHGPIVMRWGYARDLPEVKAALAIAVVGEEMGR